MAEHFVWQGQDLLLRCHFQPGAASNDIVGLHGDRLKLRITAPPVDGKANDHIIRWFATLFAVTRDSITIVQGTSSRQKNILIRSPQTLPDALLVSR